MFWRLLFGSLRHRRARLGVAVLAVLLGAAMVSTLLNLSFDVSGQTSRELRAYGANVLLLPRGAGLGLAAVLDERGIAESDLDAVERVPGVVGYVPYLYLLAQVRDQSVVAAGTAFDRLQSMGPALRVDGRWPASADEALAGVGIARALALSPGDRFTIGFREAQRTFVVAGLVQTGGAQDSQLLIPLAAAQTLTGRRGQVGLVEVSALTGDRPIGEMTRELEARLPGVEARALRQLSEAEEGILGKVRLLIALVAVAVMVVAALALGSTMFTSVLERRAEIGLMKALGAAERRVAAFFLAEATGLGTLGGVLGYLIGLGLAALIGRQVFNAGLRPSAIAFPITLGVAVAVTLIASLWPVRRALAVDPAITLRGE